ncbi:MAG: hypothetical protein WB783_17175 [Arenicellales bacterium]
MLPQSQFTVVAPIAPDREASLRQLLDTMNSAPGVADPGNAVLPFGQFDRLHFARLVVLNDATMVDLELCGLPRPSLPNYLAFLGDCDGSRGECLADLSRRAGEGLRRLFAHCEGFDAGEDVLSWMLDHNLPVAANYVNWIGRTVAQIREESALQRLLSARVPRDAPATGGDAQRIRNDLTAMVEAEVRAGRLALTPPEPTPPAWRVSNLLHAVGIPLVGLLVLPLLIVSLPFLLIALRKREISDPELAQRPRPEALRVMRLLEDRGVTNQFTALGAVKPGLFRRWLVTVLLVLIDYSCRHVFNRGYLARVQTIHFARWVFLDDKSRVVFASNYDGGHEAYMDDFINKVAWGLNLVFSNGLGWPKTDWLIKRGARREQSFKYYQRRHQLPSQVWYKAYPGLTLIDIRRNQRIREGLQPASMSDEQALAWLKLL